MPPPPLCGRVAIEAAMNVRIPQHDRVTNQLRCSLPFSWFSPLVTWPQLCMSMSATQHVLGTRFPIKMEALGEAFIP